MKVLSTLWTGCSGSTLHAISFRRPTATFGTSSWIGVSWDGMKKARRIGSFARKSTIHPLSTGGLSSVTLCFAISILSSSGTLAARRTSSERSMLCSPWASSQKHSVAHNGPYFVSKTSKTTTWRPTVRFLSSRPLSIVQRREIMYRLAETFA